MPKAQNAQNARPRKAPMGEFDLIARYFVPLTRRQDAALGLLDDAALFTEESGFQSVVSTDALISGVHFLADDEPGLIGRKALRVNLSDLAAMGAVPVAYTLALMLPQTTDEAWVKRFAEGLAVDQEAFGVFLAGGDTVRTPGPLSLSVTAFGRVEQGRAIYRSGAKAGDLVFVTGAIGAAGLGLQVLTGNLSVSDADIREQAITRYHLPEPRLRFGSSLGDIASSAMDVSDGLFADLGHLCVASGLGAELNFEDIPFASDDVPGFSRFDMAAAGDDYELLFTVPPGKSELVSRLSQTVGVSVTPIGRMVEGQEVVVNDPSGNAMPIKKTGFQHF
jgi:thiamine-monophosphate kinase